MTEVSSATQIPEHLITEQLATTRAENRKKLPAVHLTRARFWIFDMVALAFVLMAGLVASSADWTQSVIALGFACAVTVWFVKDKLYSARFISRRADEIRRLTNAYTKSAVSVVLVLYFFNLELNRSAALISIAAGYFLIWLEREAVRRWFASKRRSGNIQRRVVLVGGNEEGESIADMLSSHKYLGYNVVTTIDPTQVIDPNALTTIVLSEARSNDASSVVVAASGIDMRFSNRLVRDLVEAGLHVELSSTLADISPDRLTVRTLGKFPIVYIEPRHRHGWRQFAKRLFDLAIASTALTLASPIMIGIGLAVKFTSKGPILFKQERVGQNGEPFQVLKFRTMVTDAEEILKRLEEHNEGSGPLFKMKNDPRVTKIGNFLRKTSLDELPQLINVVKNEMSLVGPRPALRAEMSEWSFDLYARLRVKPGITGMWQVSGRSTTTFEQYTRLDLYYVDNWSLFIDISILLKTIPAVLKSDGAY